MADDVKAAKAVAGGDDEFLTTARARFKLAMDVLGETRRSELDDLKFAAGSPDNGWQWPDTIRRQRETDTNGARPCLTINKLPQHIKQVTNDQRQNRPAAKVLPVDDKGDPEVAELFNGIIRHIEVNSDADIAYDTACDCQVTIGEGYFRVLTDYCDEMSFDQDIKIGRIRNPFSVYMDPMIQDPSGADQQWCFITDTLTRDEFKEQYGKKSDMSWDVQGVGDDFLDWITPESVRIAEYFSFKNEKKTLCLYPDGAVYEEGSDECKAYESAGIAHVKKRETVIRKVVWAKINGAEVLERQEWAGKYIPVIRVVGNEFDVEGKLIVSGIVRNAKDAMRMYNYWTSQEAEMLALAPRAPFVGAAGQFEGYEAKWANANVANYPYLEYNPVVEDGVMVPPPQRVMPPMPSAGILQAKLGAADDIKSTTGQYNPSLGDEPQAKSGIALKQEQRRADVGTFHYIDNLSRSIRHCGRILVDLIPKIYDTKRIARIIGEDGEPDQAVIDPEQQQAFQKVQDETGEIQKIYNPSVGRYDVVVTVGPGYSTKRQEALEAMSTLVQANPELWQVIGDLLVKNMDWPGAQEMADRIKKTIPPQLLQDDENGPSPELQQAMQIIEQLQQQGMAMQQVIQQIMDSIEAQKAENDARKVQIDAYKAETERMTALQPVMTPEEITKLVQQTVSEVLNAPVPEVPADQRMTSVNQQMPQPMPAMEGMQNAQP
jgi:hypothetical protein